MEHAVQVLKANKFTEEDELARLKGTLIYHEGVQSSRKVILPIERAIATKTAKIQDYARALALLSEHTGPLEVIIASDEEKWTELLTGAIPVVKQN